MKIVSVLSFFREYDESDFELEISTDWQEPERDNRYREWLTRLYAQPIETYAQLISYGKSYAWSQSKDYIEQLNEPHTVGRDHWSYCKKATDLVCDYLNKDFLALAGVSDFELEDERFWLKIYAKRICFLRPGSTEYEQELEKVVHYRPDYLTQVEAVKDDLSALSHETVRHIVDTVFINSDEPSLSAEEKYFAYSLCYANEITRYCYDAKIRISAEDKDPICCSEEEYNNLETLWDIAKNDAPTNEKYKKICNHIRSSKISVGIGEGKTFYTLADCIVDMLHYLIRKNVTIKICPNCGRYFVPETRSDTIYCTNKAPQDETKTCQEYGKYINYLIKTQTDEATKLYKQIFNQKRNKVNRCKTESTPTGNAALNADFDTFQKSAKQWKADVKAGTRTEAEYIEWLRAVKEKKV